MLDDAQLFLSIFLGRRSWWHCICLPGRSGERWGFVLAGLVRSRTEGGAQLEHVSRATQRKDVRGMLRTERSVVCGDSRPGGLSSDGTERPPRDATAHHNCCHKVAEVPMSRNSFKAKHILRAKSDSRAKAIGRRTGLRCSTQVWCWLDSLRSSSGKVERHRCDRYGPCAMMMAHTQILRSHFGSQGRRPLLGLGVEWALVRAATALSSASIAQHCAVGRRA